MSLINSAPPTGRFSDSQELAGFFVQNWHSLAAFYGVRKLVRTGCFDVTTMQHRRAGLGKAPNRESLKMLAGVDAPPAKAQEDPRFPSPPPLFLSLSAKRITVWPVSYEDELPSPLWPPPSLPPRKRTLAGGDGEKPVAGAMNYQHRVVNTSAPGKKKQLKSWRGASEVVVPVLEGRRVSIALLCGVNGSDPLCGALPPKAVVSFSPPRTKRR